MYFIRVTLAAKRGSKEAMWRLAVTIQGTGSSAVGLESKGDDK